MGGVPLALVSAKLLACVCGYILYRTAFHRPLAIATGLCLGLAAVPWIGIVAPLLMPPGVGTAGPTFYRLGLRFVFLGALVFADSGSSAGTPSFGTASR